MKFRARATSIPAIDLAAIRSFSARDEEDDVDPDGGFQELRAAGLGDAIRRRWRELDDQALLVRGAVDFANDNVRGYAQLAHQVRTLLQMGENYYGARDLFDVLLRRRCALRRMADSRCGSAASTAGCGRRCRRGRAGVQPELTSILNSARICCA